MNNEFDIAGKTAVVTGASSGLGAAAAVAYSAAGANVVLIGRRIDKLECTAQKIRTVRPETRVLIFSCDVSDAEAAAAAIENTKQEFGRVDILLNNAGITKAGTVETMSEDEWRRIFAVNVDGMYHMAKAAVPVMREQQYGKIVNISSVNAYIGTKGDEGSKHAYNASKSAVIGLTKGMSATYMKYGITVNAICPGLFRTEMTEEELTINRLYERTYNAICPAGRIGTEGELNGTVLYLSSDASRYVTGQVITVDGGTSLV